MSQIKGPAVFLAQFAGAEPPFDTLDHITAWAKALGYAGVQIPASSHRMIDLHAAASSKDYCHELKESCNGLAITELAAHLFGQMIVVHPSYDIALDSFAPPAVRGNPRARTDWATEGLKDAIKASAHLGLSAVPAFSGSLLWQYLYPYPPRPRGLVAAAFAELAKRWRPLLDYADDHGIDIAFEIHPSEDLHDGVTFERFLAATDNHPRARILYDPSHLLLQCIDYVGFITRYGDYIKAFHVKDAEFNPSPSSGVYGGYQDWIDRPGRFRSVGDGQIDFKSVFTKLTEVGYHSWAVLEWECCIKDAEQGAREGAEFISSMLIEPPTKAFDDFAAGDSSDELNRKLLGLE